MCPSPVERDVHPPALVILTGAPGSGKTAILSALRGAIRCIDEPARHVLAEQRASGGDGTPERNAARFVDLLLRRSIADHAQAQSRDGSTLFDRGVPDCISYAMALGTDPSPSFEAARIHRYRPTILVTRPWEQIYTTDDERTMSFVQTIDFQGWIEIAYRELGYSLLEVPRGTVEERARFVHSYLARVSLYVRQSRW